MCLHEYVQVSTVERSEAMDSWELELKAVMNHLMWYWELICKSSMCTVCPALLFFLPSVSAWKVLELKVCTTKPSPALLF